jgi:PEP-CTERM motif
MRMRNAAPLIALGVVGMLASSSAHASTITETYSFNLTGFVDISNNTAPPDPVVTGSFTVTYDPTLFYDDDTTDITVNSLTGVTVDSTLGFTYGDGELEFGGIANDSDFVSSFTNDIVVSFNVTDPSNPTFIPCSTPGFTCGNYTGSNAVDAAGYTIASSADGWFYGVQSTVTTAPSPTPEPSSLLLFGTALIGIAGLMSKRFA